MTTFVSLEDRLFCRMFGENSRVLHGDVPWELCVANVRDGWTRARRESRLSWINATKHVRSGWDAESRRAKHAYPIQPEE